MPNPLVSIVINCYNRAHFLEQTMETVFAQTYHPIEIIVIDDGSKDETPQLMAKYENKIRYYRQENQGIAVSRTTGGRMARGEYIAFQDDDDLMVPDRVAVLMNGFKEFPSAVLSVGDYEFIDSDGIPTGEKCHFQIHDEVNQPIRKPFLFEDGYAAVLWPKITPLPHTTLFRKKDADLINWFDPRFFYACSDTDFFARLAQLGTVVYVPNNVSHYRSGHSSIWHNKITATYSRFLLIEKHLEISRHENMVLAKRLKTRLRTILKQLAIYQRQNDKNDTLPEDIIHRGVSLLNPEDRMNFKLYTTFVAPIKARILGSKLEAPLRDFINYKSFRSLSKKKSS